MNSFTSLRTQPLLFAVLLLCLTSLSFSSLAHGVGDHHELVEKQKAVLVTGSSSGLGLRMTQMLSENGFFVYAGVHKESDRDALKGMENVQTVRFDVTEQSEIDEAVKFVESQGRGLYGLINNAGIADFGPLNEINVSELQRLFDVNVYGPYRVTQAFSPMIIESRGRIATTGSVAGIATAPMYGLYSMSKHAVEAYTDALSMEMARFGVEVSVIEPSFYRSNIGQAAFKRLTETQYWPQDTQYPEERKAVFARLGTPNTGPDPLAVAEAALHIMSSDKPKLRYLVTDQVAQTDAAIRSMIAKTVALNHDQRYTFNRDALIKMLDQELEKLGKQ